MNKILLTGILLALGFAGCAADGTATVTDQPLQGEINGEPWTFVVGDTDSFLSDDETFFAVFYGETQETCGFPSASGPKLIAAIPREPGTYSMSLNRNLTFSYDDGDTSQNDVSVDGVIIIEAVTETTVSGGLFAEFGSDHFADGNFELTICQD